MDSHSEIPGLKHTCHQYGEHSLQRVGVWQHDSREQSPSSAYWIIFIHGGAWRDPAITLYNFVPSIKRMLSSANLPASAVRGFASIDYRLSPHPNYPQDPASTPATELRGAKHPDHIQDVRSALSFLDAEYKIANNYVLVGHSAGGMLAHQVLMGDAAAGKQSPPVPLPAAVIGIAGIYELVGFVARHEGYDFIGVAFGTDQASWNAISPATFSGCFKSLWANDSHLAILAASPEDTLVDMPELDAMAAKLVKDGVNLIVVKDLTGDHNTPWEDGSQVADLVAKAVAQLQRK